MDIPDRGVDRGRVGKMGRSAARAEGCRCYGLLFSCRSFVEDIAITRLLVSRRDRTLKSERSTSNSVRTDSGSERVNM